MDYFKIIKAIEERGGMGIFAGINKAGESGSKLTVGVLNLSKLDTMLIIAEILEKSNISIFELATYLELIRGRKRKNPPNPSLN